MLRHEMCRQGKFLFRYRSYLPLLLVPLGAWQLLKYDKNIGNSHALDQFWDFGCLLLALVGSAIRFVAVGYAHRGTSGRNTSAGQIAEQLNTTGLYSLCRHPLYLGNLIMYVAVLLFTKSVWLAAFGGLALILYYERIIATEEEFLSEKFGDVFRNWADRTPCLIPPLRKWKKPDRLFSVLAGLRSEIYSLAAVVTMMYVLEAIEHLAVENRLTVDPVWNFVLIATLVLFFTLRHLRKHTRLLDEREPQAE